MSSKKQQIVIRVTDSLFAAIRESAAQSANGNVTEYIRNLIEADLRARGIGGYEPMPGWGGSRVIRTLDSMSNLEHDQFLDSLEG